MEYADLSTQVFFASDAFDSGLPEELVATAIGWLGSRVPSCGSWSAEERAALGHLASRHYVDSCELGYHGCEICNAVMGRGELMLRSGDNVYVAPALMLHYVDDHAYRPPTPFMVDLISWWRSPSAEACRKESCHSERPPSILPYTPAPTRHSFVEFLVRWLRGR